MSIKPTIFCIIFALIITITGGCNAPTAEDEIDRSPTEAHRHRLEQRVARRYSDSEAHYELGRLYQQDGLWEKARQHFLTTVRFDPIHRGAQAGIVKTLIQAGDEDRARTYAEVYMDQAAGSAAASLRLAVAFQGQQLDDYALKCYEQAKSLAPNSAVVHRQLGYFYLGRDDRDKARQHLTRSFELNPSQPTVAEQLGRLGVTVRTPRQGEDDIDSE